jgi:hypothetical protein
MTQRNSISDLMSTPEGDVAVWPDEPHLEALLFHVTDADLL